MRFKHSAVFHQKISIGISPKAVLSGLMNDQCDECRRLWREYATATTAHIQLDNKLKLAALTGDNAKVRVLTPQTEKAENTRKVLRGTIRAHDLQVHGETTVANDICSTSPAAAESQQ
jgi:hypothetical protein